MELLDLMKANGKAWSLYVFASANAIAKYTMRELVELGISWVWLGLESPNSSYGKLNGADTRALTATSRTRHPRARVDHRRARAPHARATSRARSKQRWPTTPTSTSSCSSRRFQARRCIERMESEGRLLPDVDLADIHGQHQFNFRHEAITPADSNRGSTGRSSSTSNATAPACSA